MSDNKISKIDFDATNNQLVVVYGNGNIDIMHTAGVTNIPDLYNKQLNTSKTINSIFFNGNFAYLACDFGIIKLNLVKKEIADTYFIGPNATEIPILSTAVIDGTIYAANASTIYQANVNDPNLVNFERWSAVTGLPGSGKFQKILNFGGSLILLRNGQLFYRSNGAWSQISSTLPAITNCNISGGKLLFGNGSATIYATEDPASPATTLNMTIASPDIEYDKENDIYWLAATEKGVMYSKNGNISEPIKPNGPAVNIPWSITFSGNKMYVVNGGRWAGSYNRVGQLMILEGGKWTNTSGNEIAAITGHPAWDFMNVAIDPLDSTHFYITSYGTGLYEFKNNVFSEWHNHLNTNGVIQTVVASTPYNYMRLDGAVFDSEGNLYFGNMGTEYGIKMRKNNGEWKSLSFTKSFPTYTLGQIMISNQNSAQKWVPSVRYMPGIFIWDDNQNKSVFYSRFPDPDNVNSYITPSNVHCLAQDKNGVIWAGTNIGPLLFYNPSKVFDADYTCSRVKIPRNDGTDLADYLLESENVKVIVIDGANRKWLGTESSGLYLMSENGQETIQHFTTTNSPLLSNNIISLSINPKTGEIMIGTDNGLMSYQSNAAEAGDTFGNVYAYPNPVRENYNGIITITGLVMNTQVKITDLNGNLIYQTISNGSLATWDGKDANGKRVHTGIYLAICVNEDGTQSTITKIMVIN